MVKILEIQFFWTSKKPWFKPKRHNSWGCIIDNKITRKYYVPDYIDRLFVTAFFVPPHTKCGRRSNYQHHLWKTFVRSWALCACLSNQNQLKVSETGEGRYHCREVSNDSDANYLSRHRHRKPDRWRWRASVTKVWSSSSVSVSRLEQDIYSSWFLRSRVCQTVNWRACLLRTHSYSLVRSKFK